MYRYRELYLAYHKGHKIKSLLNSIYTVITVANRYSKLPPSPLFFQNPLWVDLQYTTITISDCTFGTLLTLQQDHTIICALLLYNPVHVFPEKQLSQQKDYQLCIICFQIYGIIMIVLCTASATKHSYLHKGVVRPLRHPNYTRLTLSGSRKMCVSPTEYRLLIRTHAKLT